MVNGNGYGTAVVAYYKAISLCCPEEMMKTLEDQSQSASERVT
jgi:hypothetical protein